MPFARITGQGLAAIALVVAALWACLIGERLMMNNSFARQAQVMRELRQMQLLRRAEPASTPLPRLPHRSPTAVG